MCEYEADSEVRTYDETGSIFGSLADDKESMEFESDDHKKWGNQLIILMKQVPWKLNILTMTQVMLVWMLEIDRLPED